MSNKHRPFPLTRTERILQNSQNITGRFSWQTKQSGQLETKENAQPPENGLDRHIRRSERKRSVSRKLLFEQVAIVIALIRLLQDTETLE